MHVSGCPRGEPHGHYARCECERLRAVAAKNEMIAALEAQVKALTAERDAQAEAVKRMGAWLRLWRLFKGRPRSEVDAPGTPYRAFRDAERGVWNNPIARAAVEGGSK